MQSYQCKCGNRVFFDNTVCLGCGADLGWCEACRRISTLGAAGENQFECGYEDCRSPLLQCHNYVVENICNRCFVPTGDEAQVLCVCCRLTETIPDLSVPVNRVKWARLEAAKRRLIYTLDLLQLPYVGGPLPLSFDFKADVEGADDGDDGWHNAGPAEVVYTGHSDGKITINIREADDVFREKLRVTFREAHRTLIGHYHHEVGHYYWQLFVPGANERQFKQVFGDHENPPYADALKAYYKQGPCEAWQETFISMYASSHPWEDFAETFALYLDMISVLDTASHLFRSVKTNFRGRSVRPLIERFQQVGVLVNEFNRTVGLIDLVPEVVVKPVIDKLQYIHKLVAKGAAASQNPARVSAPAALP